MTRRRGMRPAGPVLPAVTGVVEPVVMTEAQRVQTAAAARAVATDQLQRLLGDAARRSQDDWTTGPVPGDTGPVTPPEVGAHAVVEVHGAAAALETATARLNTGLLHAVPTWTGKVTAIPASAVELVQLADRLQAVRTELGQLEALVAMHAGRAVRDGHLDREGALPDGRTWRIARGADRKAWKREQVEADVRRQVLSGVDPEQVIDQATGEVVDLHAILTAAQQVAGSTAPRIGKLKALGLTPDDYCETTAGPWSVQLSAPGTSMED